MCDACRESPTIRFAGACEPTVSRRPDARPTQTRCQQMTSPAVCPAQTVVAIRFPPCSSRPNRPTSHDHTNEVAFRRPTYMSGRDYGRHSVAICTRGPQWRATAALALASGANGTWRMKRGRCRGVVSDEVFGQRRGTSRVDFGLSRTSPRAFRADVCPRRVARHGVRLHRMVCGADHRAPRRL